MLSQSKSSALATAPPHLVQAATTATCHVRVFVAVRPEGSPGSLLY
jgi:hypothetical protein